jgi:hypothetical protein
MDLNNSGEANSLGEVTPLRHVFRTFFFVSELFVVAFALGLGSQFNRFESPYAPFYLLMVLGSELCLVVFSICLIRSDWKLSVVGIVTFLAAFFLPLHR